MSDEQFIAWWNSNWPDLAPTHQALHAWKAGYDAGLKAKNEALQGALDDWAYQYPDKHLREQYKEMLSE